MNFAIDIDGVVVDWDGGFRIAWNAMYPDQQIPAQSRTWESPFEDTGLSHTAFWKWIDDNEIYRDLPSLPNALLAIKMIAKKHNVTYLTARHERATDLTELWLKEHHIWFPTFHSGNKADFLADCYVDDNNDNLTAIIVAHPNKLVFRHVQPWNSHVEGTYPIDSLADLVWRPADAIQ